MNDLRLVVAVLRAVEQVQAVQRRAGALAGERRVDVRARQRRAGRQRERDVVAVARLVRLVVPTWNARALSRWIL